MASYLSYFTSNTSSSVPPQSQQQQQQQPPQYNQAQPANSTWANTVTSRIATLRKALTKDSEDDDPDNEDCSHVSNVLRAYYTQKSRQFPEWLPPDPKKPQQQPQQQYGQYGNAYGNSNGLPTHNRVSSGGRGGLSDLWDSQPAQQPPPQSQSLRAPRPTPQPLRSYDNTRQGSQASQGSLEPYPSHGSQISTGSRPLPSQRTGSFQNPSAAAATSKADRLRAKLQGGGSGRSSPAPSSSAGSFGDPDPYARPDSGGNNNSNPYASASEPWTNNNAPGGRDPGSGPNSRGYGNPAYRPRPGGPR